jgi:hypothetical protein
MEQFQSCNADLKALEEMMEKKGSEREGMINFLDNVSVNAQRIQDTIIKCRSAIEQ